jgi:hypothetical protein
VKEPLKVKLKKFEHWSDLFFTLLFAVLMFTFKSGSIDSYTCGIIAVVISTGASIKRFISVKFEELKKLQEDTDNKTL